MLHYTSLFADLEARFRAAGREPGSYRRLQREVERAAQDVRDYCAEVATDWVARLERRLASPEARLSVEEQTLARAVLGLPLPDAERDRTLADDVARLEAAAAAVRPLAGAKLTLGNLDALRRHLDRMAAALPRIVDALEEREREARFEAALREPFDRQWLLTELRRAVAPPEETEEGP